MSADTLTRRRRALRSIETCPACKMPVNRAADHLIEGRHSVLRRMGDIFWINAKEAFYLGRHYKPQGLAQ